MGAMSPILMMLLMFGVFYFILIRPQVKRQREQQEMLKKLDKGEKVLVIDVRTDEEIKSGSIPGAIHIPMEQLEGRMKEIPKDVQLVFT